ncbi:MAG: FtsX-like permease family protein [Acidobacteria bacterium]|nr:FtsX-like permease family protein [Acidobacteriota bacterium]
MFVAPPRAATWLLRRILDPRQREWILDDLAEDYRRRRDLTSGFTAYRWYWTEVRRSLRPSFDSRQAHRQLIPPTGRSPMDVITNDLKQTARRLVQAPGFTLAAIVTLSLGIGANAAIFSLVNGILLRSLPYPEAGNLYSVQHSAPGLGVDMMETSMGVYVHYLRNADSIESAGVLVRSGVNHTGDGEPQRLAAVALSSSFLRTLGVQPVLGQSFTTDDDLVGTPSRVLLSHAMWQQQFGGDPGVVGESITLQAVPREIIGVLPEGFAFPSPDIAIYLSMKVPEDEIRFGGFFRNLVIRTKPGVSGEQLAAELDALVPSLADAYDVPTEMVESAEMRSVVLPLKERFLGNIERPLGILFGTVGLVLLIACANVANLFLVRAEGRSREVAVRRALGASRGRLVGLLATEASVLGGVSALIGLSIAWFGVRMVQVSGVSLPRLGEVTIDANVIAFTAVIALFATALFGAVPGLRLMRRNLESSLHDDGRSATLSRGGHRARNVLVGAQMALALMRLVGSALMAQSSWRLVNADPGYRTEGLLTAEVLLPEADYPTEEDVIAFYSEVTRRVEALPGVESAAATSELPLQPGTGRWDVLYVEGNEPAADTLPPAVIFRYVTENYFETLGIPIQRGRGFNAADGPGAPVAIVSQTTARDFWAGEDALGGTAWQDLPPDQGEAARYRVVGITGETFDTGMRNDATPLFYFPVLEAGADNLHWVPSSLRIIARMDGDPDAHAADVRRAIWSIDPDLPIANVRSMESIVAESTLNTRFTMTLLVLAAGIALFLGAIGLYGTISYVVSLRTREIGVRMALGAAESDVSRMVLRQGTIVAAAGLVVGTVAALGLSRVLDSLLYDVSATDPLTYAIMATLLLAVAAAASYIPARRASRLDPLEGLRAD